jgi:hypothetical protein
MNFRDSTLVFRLGLSSNPIGKSKFDGLQIQRTGTFWNLSERALYANFVDSS